MLKDWHEVRPEDILRLIQEVGSQFTFDGFQNVFKSLMGRPTRVIANNGKYFQ
jgi:hypothetical protein